MVTPKLIHVSKTRTDSTWVPALPLVAAAVTDKSLVAGSKAGRLAPQGLVPVYKTKDTISLSGLVPR